MEYCHFQINIQKIIFNPSSNEFIWKKTQLLKYNYLHYSSICPKEIRVKCNYLFSLLYIVSVSFTFKQLLTYSVLSSELNFNFQENVISIHIFIPLSEV